MNRSALNMKIARANARVSLFWPPAETGGYASIVNGTTACEHWLTGVTMAEITLTNSVSHCPGPQAQRQQRAVRVRLSAPNMVNCWATGDIELF